VKVERVSFVLGLALFVWLVHRIGVAAITTNLGKLGAGFLVILALEFIPLSLATLGWRATRRSLRRIPLRSLLAMRLAGDAVNAVAPAAVLGGEIIRGKLLSRFVSPAEVLSSVSLAAMAQFIAQALFVGTGAMLLPVPSLQPRLQIVGGAILVLLAVFGELVARWTGGREQVRTHPRFVAWLDSVTRGRLAGFFRWDDLTARLGDTVRGRNGSLTISILCYTGGWLVAVPEVYLILKFFGAPAGVPTAFSIAVLMVAVEGIFFFVPARAGILEGGLYAIFSVLGLDPVLGVSLGLVRRLRELTWAALGLTLLGVADRLPVPPRDREAERAQMT
jgi:lysylphosphatidylglycerol synthase-like protein